MVRKSSSVMQRCRGSLLYMFMSPYCRLCLSVGLIAGTGLIVGVLLDQHLLSECAHHQLRPFAFKAAESVRSSHESNSEEGSKKYTSVSSIQKDLHKQFQDYMPKHVFIDCTYGPPDSLELFLETYPASYRYSLYTFLVDSSYKPLFAKFKDLTLYQASAPSDKLNTTTIYLPDVQKPGRNVSVAVTYIDFSKWLKDVLHRDDCVVVKMCPDKNVPQILDSLVETGSLEWVDKIYVPSEELLANAFAGDKSDPYRDKVFLWNDKMQTYSDFDTINRPLNAGMETVEITECSNAEGSDKLFVLLLYMSSLNQQAYSAFSLLHKMSKKHDFQLPLTLFLPLEYLEVDKHCANVSALGAAMELGLYFSESFMLTITDSSEDEKQNNVVRNKLVQAEHCFTRGDIILRYILPKYALTQLASPVQGKPHTGVKKLLKQIIYERAYNVMVGVKDVTFLAETPYEYFLRFAEKTESGLLAIDLSKKGTDALLLQILSANFTSLMPAHICAMYHN